MSQPDFAVLQPKKAWAFGVAAALAAVLFDRYVIQAPDWLLGATLAFLIACGLFWDWFYAQRVRKTVFWIGVAAYFSVAGLVVYMSEPRDPLEAVLKSTVAFPKYSIDNQYIRLGLGDMTGLYAYADDYQLQVACRAVVLGVPFDQDDHIIVSKRYPVGSAPIEVALDGEFVNRICTNDPHAYQCKLLLVPESGNDAGLVTGRPFSWGAGQEGLLCGRKTP